MFSKRLISSFVLWAILLSVLFFLPPEASALLCCLIGTLALAEFYDILLRGHLKCFKYWGLAGGLILSGGTWYCSAYLPQWTSQFEIMFLVFFFLTLLLKQLLDANHPDSVPSIGNTMFGIIYIPWLFNFFPKLKYLHGGWDGPGWLLAFYLVAVTKLCDTGAYLVGRAFGRHKMVPRISPNKTWEGILGGFVFAIVGSLTIYHYWKLQFNQFGFERKDAMILGVLLGIVGIMGDLGESMLKRETHVKDSGEVLPGIGGALDLIDSLLFTAPVFYFYLLVVTKHS